MEELGSFPAFYCKICKKEFYFENPLKHIQSNVFTHDENCLVTEENINNEEKDIIRNILYNLQKRNDDINLLKKQVKEKSIKINELKLFLEKNLSFIEEKYELLLEQLKKETNTIKQFAEKIIQFESEKVYGFSEKLKKLINFKKLNLHLDNNYFNKRFDQGIEDEINTKRKEIYKKFISEFKNNKTDLNNNNNMEKLKERLSKLKLDELKIVYKNVVGEEIIDEIINENDICEEEEFNCDYNNDFLNFKRERSYFDE